MHVSLHGFYSSFSRWVQFTDELRFYGHSLSFGILVVANQCLAIQHVNVQSSVRFGRELTKFLAV